MDVFAVLQAASPRTRAAIRLVLIEDLVIAKQDSDAPSTNTSTSTSQARESEHLDNNGDASLPSCESDIQGRCHLPSSSVMKDDTAASSSSSGTQDTLLRKLSDASLCIRVQSEMREWRLNADIRKLRENKDHMLALKLAEEWDLENAVAAASYNAGSDAEREVCVICMEKAVHPVGCIYCKQLVGCFSCVMKWHETSNNGFDRAGFPSSSSRSCPLCRADWHMAPKVESWKYMNLKGRTATRPAKLTPF